MNLEEVKLKSNKILANFINEIGLDGEFYASLNQAPMVWGLPKFNGCGEFIAPNTQRLSSILKTSSFNNKDIINEYGIILINEEYRQKDADPNLYVTTIHEMLHANRNLLLFDVNRDNSNEAAYSYDNNKLNQNTLNYSSFYADASQDIIKGNIDNSKNNIKKYSSMSEQELEDLEFVEGKKDNKMEKQQIVDEALIELMSALSYKLYSSKEKGKNIDLWQAIEQAKNAYDGEDIGVMCQIILKHKDFELFNWILDPIEYSKGNIHYDFFEEYTKNDKELLKDLYYDDEFDVGDSKVFPYKYNISDESINELINNLKTKENEKNSDKER